MSPYFLGRTSTLIPTTPTALRSTSPSLTLRSSACSAAQSWDQDQAGGVLRASTPPKLNHDPNPQVCRSFTLEVSRAPISVECLFSMALLPGKNYDVLMKLPDGRD